MNPLGFKSAIYQLARTGDAGAPPMFDVADSMLAAASSKMAMGQRTTATEQLVTSVAQARAAYASAIDDGIAATYIHDVAHDFHLLAHRLKGVGTGMAGPAVSHVSSAREAAKQVTRALQTDGIGPTGALPESAHRSIWQLRNDLDEAWNALGMAKVTGTLPR